MSFKFGLNAKNKTSNGLAKPGLKSLRGKKKPLFDDDEDEDEAKSRTKAADGAQEIVEFTFEDTLAPKPESSKPAPPRTKKGQPPTAPPTRRPKPRADDPTALENSASAKESETRAQEALQLDATIYDYDAAYDALHARNAAKKAAEQQDALDRKPKYLDNLLESAHLRKKDQLRAQDKLIQREREAEGDAYADKDKFVTSAYKAQQEETRKAELDEQARQAAQEATRKKFGMQAFHKQILLDQELRHREAMHAAAQAVKLGQVPQTTAPQQEREEEKTDAQIVQEMKEKGKHVILNEDGQIADRRQLLTAGLNIIAKPKAAAAAAAASHLSSDGPAPLVQQAWQRGANKHARNAQRERQTHLIALQIEAAAKRKADEEAEEQARLQHASKSRKTEGEIMGAKERYLKRKREAEAARAASGK